MRLRFATRAAMPKFATVANVSSARIFACVFTDSVARCGLLIWAPKPPTAASTL